MKVKLKTTCIAPFNGFRYLDFDTGKHFRMLSFPALVAKVRKARIEAGFSVEGLEDEIMFQLCIKSPKGACVNEDGTEFVPPQYNFRSLNPAMIFKASETILKWFIEGKELCDLNTAKQRVAICFRCPLQVQFYTCRCGKLRKEVERIIPQERRDCFAPPPGACASCGCSVLAKANLPKHKILESNENMGYWFPKYCWQRE